MNIVLHDAWTVERFLNWEEQQEGKHEFDGTQIIEMTGGSRAHQRIVGNLRRLLDDCLDLDRFDAIQKMRIDVGGKIRYPDVLVVAPPVNEDTLTLRDAVVIFEVLSKDTADRDLGSKLAEYFRLPSIRTRSRSFGSLKPELPPAGRVRGFLLSTRARSLFAGRPSRDSSSN